MRRCVFILALFVQTMLAQDPTDAQHVLLDLEINTVAQTVAGTCTWTFLSTGAGLGSVTLQLHSNLTVSAVAVDGSPAAWTRPADAIAVTLNPPAALNQVFTVAVTYSGAPANLGMSSFTFQTHGTPATPIIASLSEPYFAYSWWPCKETLTDKFTTETWFTVPATLTATGNGLLQGTDALPGARTRYRWASNYPIATYGVSVTATNYQLRTDTYTGFGANMPVLLYAYPESYASQQANMNRIVTMLTTFSGLVGQFPFANEKYGICQFGWGGGMEHQTITSQADFSENLSAHELGHSWWGNSITCATWHDIGLNEGFATYMEALWDEFKPGGGVSTYFSRMNSNKPSSITSSGSVYVVDTSNVNNIFSTNNVYRKGAWFLHSLRHVVGDTAFFQILRDYRTAKDYQSATWQDFGAIASTSWGQDLTWFVNQGVMRTSAPTFRLAWTNATIGGQAFVLGNMTQTQTALPFRYPVDVRVTTASGQVTTPVWSDQVRDDFVLPATGGTATALALDPAPWILRGTNATGTFAPSLVSNTSTINSAGGTITLTLNAGTSNANKAYLIGGSLAGIWPGIVFVDGKRVPLIADDFLLAVLQQANGPIFQGFSGTLNANGQATAQIVVPNLSGSALPLTAYFSFITTASPIFTSTPIAITVTP